MAHIVYHPVKYADTSPADPPAVDPAPTTVTIEEAVPEKKIAFGITLTINGVDVPVATDDLGNIKKKGIDLALPGPVTIGTIDEFIKWFGDEFGIDLPPAASFPEPFKRLIGGIGSLVWTVNAAHVRVPPSAEEGGEQGPTRYTIMITASWPEDDPFSIIDGKLAVKGFSFGVTNEDHTDPQ